MPSFNKLVGNKIFKLELVDLKLIIIYVDFLEKDKNWDEKYSLVEIKLKPQTNQ